MLYGTEDCDNQGPSSNVIGEEVSHNTLGGGPDSGLQQSHEVMLGGIKRSHDRQDSDTYKQDMQHSRRVKATATKIDSKKAAEVIWIDLVD